MTPIRRDGAARSWPERWSLRPCVSPPAARRRPPSARCADASSAAWTLTHSTRLGEAGPVRAALGDRAAELVVLDHDQVLEADAVRAARDEAAVVGEAVAAEARSGSRCASSSSTR